MKKHATKNKCADMDKTEFRSRYAKLAARVKAIKAKLKDVLKDAKVLSKDAYVLRKFGNEKLYVEDHCDIQPAFRGLPNMMDMLDWWEDIEFGVSDAIATC